jgi:hypothetical protein
VIKRDIFYEKKEKDSYKKTQQPYFGEKAFEFHIL